MSDPSDPATRLIAHRGNAFEFPENTLPALRSVLELGVQHIEFDVHLSADGVPVVMHDDNLQRCAGLDRDALAMTRIELQTVSVHEPSRLGERFAGTPIPALSELVVLLGQFPQATAFVEIKRASLRRFGTQLVVKQVCAQLQPVASQVVVISFDLEAVLQVRGNYALRIGWVLTDYSSDAKRLAETYSPEFLFCNQDKLPADESPLWRGPWQWALYEISSCEQASQLISRGAQLLETMQVRKLLHELRSTANL